MPESAEARRAAVAAALSRLREEARESSQARSAGEVLPPARPVVPGTPIAPAPETPAVPDGPRRPDNAAVNELCGLPHAAPGGLRGLGFRILRRLMAPLVDVQTRFNGRQAQLDNELLEYIDARFARTHAHYDAVLGHYGRHLGEADERHVLLQNELVAHVHDLVRRIDLVLAESERSRLSLEAALRDLRTRLQQIEARLPPTGK
jgi:hypothetical protein